MEDATLAAQDQAAWLTPGVAGIGSASLLSDVGHEIATALLPGFLNSTLGAPAAALGLIEGIADGCAGAAKFAGGAIADDPVRRRSTAIGGYTATALLTSAIGLTTAAWQVGVLRTAAWTARGLRVPARNALLADIVQPAAYGRAYGFERMMDNIGAIGGPVLALALVAAIGVRAAIIVGVVPGLLAALAIAFAIRFARVRVTRERRPLRFQVRPVLRGALGRIFIGVTAFEVGNVAATLLILRTTQVLTPDHGKDDATTIALALYIVYNLVATLSSLVGGRMTDRAGAVVVLAAGTACFALAYGGFAATGPQIVVLGAAFGLAGLGIGLVETAENAAVAIHAPDEIRGSAFGLLAAVQSGGNFIASGLAGVLWSLLSPEVAFLYLVACMAAALFAFAGTAARTSRQPTA